jgi:serum/glucocorticoid-regulated kinase 2
MIQNKPQTASLDFWALGVLAYRLVVGHLPFESSNVKRLFDLIVKGKPKIPSRLDKTTADLIKQLLTPDPAKRLGATPGRIMEHPYFQDVNWSAVVRMEVKPDFVPETTGEDSVDNFDHEFTSEVPNDSFVDNPSLISPDVTGFSYQSEDALL